jgi:hypothetical protein
LSLASEPASVKDIPVSIVPAAQAARFLLFPSARKV